MFNIGGLELVAIALVALVVLGPDKLPAALRQAGALLGQVRRMSDSFRIDVNAALAEDAVDRPGAEPRID
ncbi:MAG TPA: Sec-independent protein translocase protein TatB [Acidimicrobiales bacterium]|nr:Sec-independent protein translocase protein TatB [Acidimicrobiales bacterium]